MLATLMTLMMDKTTALTQSKGNYIAQMRKHFRDKAVA